MKTLILAALVALTIAGCTVTEPAERYYPQDRVYTSPYYTPVYQGNYTIRRVYDYNTGRYYDVPVYNSPVYSSPVYSSPVYNSPVYSNGYRRDSYRNDSRYRREYYNQPQADQRNSQPQYRVEQPREKKMPDGTRITSDGTVIKPNGEVKRSR